MSRFSSLEARTTAALLASSLVAGIGAGALSRESSAGTPAEVTLAKMDHELKVELSPAMLQLANTAIEFAQNDEGAPRKDTVSYSKFPSSFPANGHHDYLVKINTKRDGRSYRVQEISDQPGDHPSIANLESVEVSYAQDFAGGGYTEVTDAIIDFYHGTGWFAGRDYSHKNIFNKITAKSPTTASVQPALDPATGKKEFTRAQAEQKLKNGALVVRNMKKLVALALKGAQ